MKYVDTEIQNCSKVDNLNEHVKKISELKKYIVRFHGLDIS